MTQDSTISKDNFKNAILELESAFRVPEDRKMDAEMLKVWFRYLKNITSEQLHKATKSIIYNDTFFPSIARILDAAGVEGAPAPKALTREDIDERCL